MNTTSVLTSGITSIITPIITPVIKHTIHGSLVLWEDTSRAGLYEAFLMMSEDYAKYTPVKFESL